MANLKSGKWTMDDYLLAKEQLYYALKTTGQMNKE